MTNRSAYCATLLTILVAACEDTSARFHPTPIYSALTAAITKGPGATAVLDSLGPSDWTAMYVFGPYTSVGLMRRCMGTTAPFETYGLDSHDASYAIMFKNRNGRISSMGLPRSWFAFAPEVVTREYPRGSASFGVRTSPTGGMNELTAGGGQTRACS